MRDDLNGLLGIFNNFKVLNQGKYVFAQLTEFLPGRVFDGIVDKYNGYKYVKHFNCWNQLLVMIFGQLSNRDSLRDLIVSLDAHHLKKLPSRFWEDCYPEKSV